MKNNPTTKMFAGFRMIRKKIDGKVVSIPKAPQFTLTKNLFKFLEKCKTLTELQHSIVQEQLNKCTEKVSPEYIARLCAILEKPVTGKLEDNK
jgi:hypothetical protein